jgi:hypothetical protein
MTTEPLTTLTLLGLTFDVYVTTDGTFYVRDSRLPEQVKATSFYALRDLLQTATRKAKIELNVPFVTGGGDRGVVRGVHASRRGILLVTWASGAKGEIYASSLVLSPDAPVDRLVAIDREILALNAERGKIEATHRLDLHKAMTDAGAEASD